MALGFWPLVLSLPNEPGVPAVLEQQDTLFTMNTLGRQQATLGGKAVSHGGVRSCTPPLAAPVRNAAPRRACAPAPSLELPARIRPNVAARASLTQTLQNYKTSIVKVPRGETNGAVMVLNTVTIQAGDRDLMEDVSWRVMPGQRWGLVGSNGCGKSTLLRALCGIRGIDAGKMIVAPKVEVGYLAQTAVSGSENTVYQEARSQMTRLIKSEQDMAKAELKITAGEEGGTEALAAAQEAWVMAGGGDSDKRITNVLMGLGFRMEQLHIPASQFSGGWQMRIALARLLLGEAGQAASAGLNGGLMLLDEPTNHLDSGAIKWLGQFLCKSGGTLVVVSHDEALLEDVCDHIAEVRGGQLHQFTGGFKSFMGQRSVRESQALATSAAQKAEIDRLEGFVKKFGAKASKASAAQSKQKMADKLRNEMVAAPAAAAATGGGDAKKVTLKLPPAPPCFMDVLKLTGAAVGWGEAPPPLTDDSDEEPDRFPLLSDVEVTIKKGQRVLVLGPNGAGKSTLLKALSGSIPLWEGQRKVGEGVQLGIFSQDLAQDLPLDKTAMEYVEEAARAHDPRIKMEQCRAALGALGLGNSLVGQKIGVLSGGEKARVALAAFALVPANVLLLDEASNHLDVATIKVLTGALQDFKGAIVAITHNQSFAASLNATHILRVAGGQATMSSNMGLVDSDFEHVPEGPKKGNTPAPKRGLTPAVNRALTPSATRTETPPLAEAVSAPAASKKRGLAWKEQQEYGKLQKQVKDLTTLRDTLQTKVSNLAASGGGNFKAMQAASAELGTVAEQLDTLESRWMELADMAGDL